VPCWSNMSATWFERIRGSSNVLATWSQLRPNASRLVVCQFLIDGYTLFSLTRASAIVKRQLMVVLASLR
jgi:hypothetical protein